MVLEAMIKMKWQSVLGFVGNPKVGIYELGSSKEET